MTTTLHAPPEPGVLRSQRFDACFVLGPALLGLTAIAVVHRRPELFVPLLTADLWLLGYHHVVSTFTRLGGDRDVRRQYRALLHIVPLAVIAAVAVLWSVGGAAALATLYLYWQWFHYVRQSWGILRAYQRKSTAAPSEPEWLLQAAVWAVPVWGILHRSAQSPDTFLGLPLWTVPVPMAVADVAGVAALVIVVVVLGRRVLSGALRDVRRWETTFLAVHGSVFAVGYVVTASIDVGWLGVNIWHNLQYVLFVWHFNRNRFRDGIAPEARVVSWLSQPRRVVPYFVVCLAVSTILYKSLGWTIAAVVPPVVVYQFINFHHYVADSVIWKMRRPEVREAAIGVP